MANKDFLSQFSNSNKQEKPDSFKEEVRIPVSKKHINPLVIVIPIVSVLVIAAILVLIFVMPHIKVVDFVGQNKTDVVAWIKQQEIETSGIIFKEEYDLDKDEGVVISQDPVDGKVTKNAKMTFTISKGADPSESISVPELKDMTKTEIEAWIKKNKLQATKITTAYDDEVESGKVIKVEFTNADETSFTRGTTLKISISKGVKPADQITVSDFVKKTYEEMETWAKTNKLTLKKSESYSDTIDKGLIISQSVKEKSKVNQGETISVVVSKGKAIKMPDLSTYTLSEAEKFFDKNGIEINKEYVYSAYKKDILVAYSPVDGTILNDRDDVTLTVSLGNRVSIDIGVGDTEEELLALRKSLNNQGANLDKDYSSTATYSYVYKKGEITSIACKKGTDACNLEDAPLDAKIEYSVSAGKIYTIDACDIENRTEGSSIKFSLIKLADMLSGKGIKYSISKPEGITIDGDSDCVIKIGANESTSGIFEIKEEENVEIIYK